MGEVADALRSMLEDWHGRKHGALTALAGKIQMETGKDVRKRLYRELKGRPSWECVQWIVSHCVPANGSSPHPDHQLEALERLAGIWRTERSMMPPGYLGRVVYGGEELRAAVQSSADAEDLIAQTILLSRERQDAEQDLHRQKALANELREEISVLRREADQLNQASTQEVRRFAESSGILLDQIRILQHQLDAATVTGTEYVQENQRLLDLQQQLLHERDTARDLADRRYQEIEQLRLHADETRHRFQQTIDDLETQLTVLRHDLNSVHTATARPVPVHNGREGGTFELKDGILRRRDDKASRN